MDKDTTDRIERLIGFRIATELLLKDVLVRVYATAPDGLRRSKEWNCSILVDLEWPEGGPLDGEAIRHHALASLDKVVSEALAQLE